MRSVTASPPEPNAVAAALPQRVVAEFLGALLLVAVVIGSGIMGERLADGNDAIALLGNTLATAAALFVLCVAPGASAADDPLPSWNEGATKQSIIDFVTRVTKEGGPDYVKLEERVATFDNDGTLWIEQPMYNQFVFAVDEVKKQANQHPEWKDKEPFKSVLAGDMKAVAAMGETLRQVSVPVPVIERDTGSSVASSE